jgi:hypothetical protein
MAQIKPKTCKACRVKFTPTKPLQRVCSPACAIAELGTKKAKAARVDRIETAKALSKIKSRATLIKESQAAFNAYIRARDAGKPCICCGMFPKSYSGSGGEWDAGHYRSRGAAPEVRFDERNIHAQLKQCNRRSWDVRDVSRWWWDVGVAHGVRGWCLCLQGLGLVCGTSGTSGT